MKERQPCSAHQAGLRMPGTGVRSICASPVQTRSRLLMTYVFEEIRNPSSHTLALRLSQFTDNLFEKL